MGIIRRKRHTATFYCTGKNLPVVERSVRYVVHNCIQIVEEQLLLSLIFVDIEFLKMKQNIVYAFAQIVFIINTY
jgi:hypothetical protein